MRNRSYKYRGQFNWLNNNSNMLLFHSSLWFNSITLVSFAGCSEYLYKGGWCTTAVRRTDVCIPVLAYARYKVEASERKPSAECPKPQDLFEKWTERYGRIPFLLLLCNNIATYISISRTAFCATVFPQKLLNVLQWNTLRNSRLNNAKHVIIELLLKVLNINSEE